MLHRMNAVWSLIAAASVSVISPLALHADDADDGPREVSKSLNADRSKLSSPKATLPRGDQQQLQEAKQFVRLANQAIDKRDFRRAESLLRDALKIEKECLGDESQQYTRTLGLLGCVCIWRDEYQEAEDCLRRALENQRRLVGKDDTAYVDALTNLAGLYLKTESYVQAKPLLLDVVAGRKRQYGGQHVVYAASLNNLGLLYLRTDDVTAAEPLFREALEIYRKKVGEAHPAFTDCLEKLGQLYVAKGDYLVAEQFLLRAAGTYEKTLPKNHPALAQSFDSYAAMLRKAKRDSEAERVEQRANEIRDAIKQAELRLSAQEAPKSAN